MTTNSACHHCIVPDFREMLMADTMLGTRDKIPANRMMEIPLPIPNSVTCSPIHITKEEPAMKEIMMTSAAHTPVLVRMLAFFIRA